MDNALRLLLTLFTILCSATISGASIQESHEGAVFEKVCVLEGEIGFLPNFNAPKSVVDKSWKAKIHGTGQKTGTPGHQFRMYREAIAEAKNPNVTSVHLDHGYNRALGLNPKTISPNRRPDVTSIYGNRVRRVEVQSRTDVPSILSGRNSALDPQLIQNGFTPTPPVIIRPTTSP